MSITNELREYAEMVPRLTSDLDAIADRIDAEHEREVADTRNDALFRANEKDMGELGWVRLPKDADGKVIRIGDVLDNTHKDGFAAKAVIGISYHPGGKTCVEVDENRLRWHDPSKLRHHRTTVEDVLASYGSAAIELHHEHKNGEMGFEEYHAAMDRLAAMYAAKLRLAESEGE